MENKKEQNLNPQNVDQVLAKDQQEKTAADFEKTVQQAAAETETRKPGESAGPNDGKHHTGRGGGKS